METINFNDCTLVFLDKHFTTRRVESLNSLNEWLKADMEISDLHIGMIQLLTNSLQQNVLHWNEQDLSLHFIGPMFSLISFTKPYRFNLFAQRTFSAVINDIQLSGKVDEVIATGYQEPEAPFFAFNEYKKEMEYKGDPAGQALAAMLVGQSLNDNTKPIYGCYVIGSIWRFMTLEGKRYAISKSYDGTDFEDACQILRILFQLKEYCMERTQAPDE